MISLRNESGYATVMVLGITLVVAAILVAYGLWVRWEAASVSAFIDRIEAHQHAQSGIQRGILLLLEDVDPDIDHLEEAWSTGWTDERLTVRITDLGSQLGLNWVAQEHLVRLFDDYPAEAEHLFRWINEHHGVINSWKDCPLDEDLLLRDEGFLTILSPLNINVLAEDPLQRLWHSAGADPGRAADIAREIVQRREENPFLSEQDLLQIPAISTDYLRAVRPWLVFSGPININTAPSEVLLALLGEEQASSVLEIRADGPVDLHELRGRLGDKLDGIQWLSAYSEFFSITSTVEQPFVSVEAVVRRTYDKEKMVWTIEVLTWTERYVNDQS